MPEDEQEFQTRAFNQFLEIWVVPEIKRRQEAGKIPKPFDLHRFQLIWFRDGRPMIIRLNEEVKAGAVIRKTESIETPNPGEEIVITPEMVERIVLQPQEDQNCGHATYIRIENIWMGSWDAIYNKGHARRYLAAGDEFLQVAESALVANKLAAFVDNLFSAAELLAKAKLCLFSEQSFIAKSNHEAVSSRINMQRKMGNVETDHCEAFNRLALLRPRARYQDRGPFTIELSDANELLESVRGLREDVARWTRREPELPA